MCLLFFNPIVIFIHENEINACISYKRKETQAEPIFWVFRLSFLPKKYKGKVGV